MIWLQFKPGSQIVHPISPPLSGLLRFGREALQLISITLLCFIAPAIKPLWFEKRVFASSSQHRKTPVHWLNLAREAEGEEGRKEQEIAVFATARWADSGLNSFQVIFSCVCFLQPGVFIKWDFSKYKEWNQVAVAFNPTSPEQMRPTRGQCLLLSASSHLSLFVLHTTKAISRAPLKGLWYSRDKDAQFVALFLWMFPHIELTAWRYQANW